MDKLWKYIIVSSAFVLAAMVLAAAYTGRTRDVGTISVTGLGEKVFTSDLVVINASIRVENANAADGYVELERQRAKVEEFLKGKGVAADSISYAMPMSHELFEDQYAEGNYVGRRLRGYMLSQSFTISSNDIDKVEAAARELPSLMAEGIMVSVSEPLYYYTELESVKHDLIGAAAEDAYKRAEIIATNSQVRLGRLAQSRSGVFQITAATGDEEFSAGGSFNLSSREKKARVTVRAEYKIKIN